MDVLDKIVALPYDIKEQIGEHIQCKYKYIKCAYLDIPIKVTNPITEYKPNDTLNFDDMQYIIKYNRLDILLNNSRYKEFALEYNSKFVVNELSADPNLILEDTVMQFIMYYIIYIDYSPDYQQTILKQLLKLSFIYKNVFFMRLFYITQRWAKYDIHTMTTLLFKYANKEMLYLELTRKYNRFIHIDLVPLSIKYHNNVIFDYMAFERSYNIKTEISHWLNIAISYSNFHVVSALLALNETKLNELHVRIAIRSSSYDFINKKIINFTMLNTIISYAREYNSQLLTRYKAVN